VSQQVDEKVSAIAANELNDSLEEKRHLISVSESREDQMTKKTNQQERYKMPITVGTCCQSSLEWPISKKTRSALCHTSFQGQDQREVKKQARQV
jgi:hypothetical protein